MKKGSKKNIRITRGQRIFDFFNMIFLMFLCVVMFYPMWHVVCASFSDANELAMKNGVMLLPLKANVNAYTSMFKHPLIMKSRATIVSSGQKKDLDITRRMHASK